MITKITDKNRTAYNDLFKIANNDLKLSGESMITSINDYFTKLDQLVKLTPFNPKYVILPLDEDFFEIDANKREIKIPDSFKNGASVVGDQGAEVIFFIIDRYFDTMDLDNQNIYIEWDAPESSGFSLEFARDTQSQPGKIIFGWALSDDITAAAGEVKFAVRFFTTKENGDGENEIQYSFSTLPSKIKINETLNFDLTDEGITTLNPNDLILKRIIASTPDGGVIEPIVPEALTVSWLKDKHNIEFESDEDGNKININDQVQAYSTDGGIIEYKLYRKNNDQTWEFLKAIPETHIQTTDTQREINNSYYLLDVNNKLIPYSGEIYSGGVDNDGNKIYELFAIYDIDETGEYSIRAYSNVKGYLSEKYCDLGTYTIPSPSEIIFSDTNNYNIILDEETGKANLNANIENVEFSNNITYQWLNALTNTEISDATTNSIEVEGEGEYKIKATNYFNFEEKIKESNIFRVTYPASEFANITVTPDVETRTLTASYTLVDNNRSDNITYQWKELDGNEEWVNIEGAISNAFEVPKLNVTYLVTVTNTYNGNTATGNGSSLITKI